jgi:hypothetical protein
LFYATVDLGQHGKHFEPGLLDRFEMVGPILY